MGTELIVVCPSWILYLSSLAAFCAPTASSTSTAFNLLGRDCSISQIYAISVIYFNSDRLTGFLELLYFLCHKYTAGGIIALNLRELKCYEYHYHSMFLVLTWPLFIIFSPSSWSVLRRFLLYPFTGCFF